MGIIPGVISVTGLGPNLVALLAPALTAFGVPELAANLYVLYFGVIADITPPVAVAAYAASGMAKSDAFQTGLDAFSLPLNKAVVPEVVIPTVCVFLGVVALAATVIGYVYTSVSRLERVAVALSSLLLMAPGLGVRGVLDVLGLVGIGSGGGGEVTLGIDLALLLDSRRGASGFFRSSSESETETA